MAALSDGTSGVVPDESRTDRAAALPGMEKAVHASIEVGGEYGRTSALCARGACRGRFLDHVGEASAYRF